MSQDTPNESDNPQDAQPSAPSPEASPQTQKASPETPSEDAAAPSEPVPTTSTPSSATPKPPRAKKGGGSSGGRGGLWLILLLLFIALCAGGWYFWQEVADDQHQLDQLQGAIQELGTQLQAERQAREREPQRRQQALAQLEQHLSGQWQQQQRTLSTLEEQLNSTRRRLNAMSTTNREGWKLAEAQYLLRLANQRLLMERDTSSALALTEQVAELFQTLNDGRLHNVRRALARDLRALRTAEQVDREGIYLQLLSLNEQLQALPLADPREHLGGEELEPEEATQPGSDASRWQRIRYRVAQSWHNLRAALSDHLRIRRHDQPIAAQLTPSEHFYMRQNLQLMMEQAQLALLREQPDIYRANLERAGLWLEQYYGRNTQTEQIHDELQQLAAHSIRSELPDLSDTLAQLNTHINEASVNEAPEKDDQEPEQ